MIRLVSFKDCCYRFLYVLNNEPKFKVLMTGQGNTVNYGDSLHIDFFLTWFQTFCKYIIIFHFVITDFILEELKMFFFFLEFSQGRT